MTPRERWLAVLNKQTPDRVPTDYWGTGEVTRRLLGDLECDGEMDLWRKLGVDKKIGIGPRYVGPDRGGLEMYGLRRVTKSYGDGLGTYDEVVEHPLAGATTVEEIDAYPHWPNPDHYDYSVLPAKAEKFADWPLHVGHYEPFLAVCHLRGQEQAMMDLVTAPEIVDAMMDRIFGFWHEHNRRCFEALGEGVVTTTYVAEDLGTQESLLMSEPMVERFLKPKMKQMCDLAHEFGIFAFHHSDGAVRPLLPGMIDIGIDILNPIQWRCPGMEREGLMADFGDRLVFHGAVDNQQTLPFGTPADVRAEVAENIAIFRNRYICAPCHNIQPNTPTENIVALYQAAREAGTF